MASALDSFPSDLLEFFYNDKSHQRANFVNQKILKVDHGQEKGAHIVPNSFIEAVLSEGGKIDLDWLYDKTEEERIKLVKEKFNWSFSAGPVRPQVLKKYEKNPESSNLLRVHGNSLFRQGNFQDALHYFNMALLFGVDESLGLAYANRAAVLMELDDPEGALEDIDLALKHSYPATQRQKLEERKLKCVEMIEKAVSENATNKSLTDEERIELNKVRDSVNHIEKRNPRAPAAADFVDIKFDENFGRQLVVTRDVDAGTLLLLEDPYVCVLDGQLSWDTEHCHHCFKRIKRGIPCGKCVFAFYCSEACLKKSLESTHQLECSLLPYLHLSRPADHVLEALKVICKVGSLELYRLFLSRDPAFFNRTFGADPEDNYESGSFLPIFHLQSQPRRSDLVVQCTLISQALTMTEHLDAETEFFESIPADQKNEFKDFVAVMMLRHVERRAVNSVGLKEYDKLDDLTLQVFIRQRMNEPEKLIARLNTDQFHTTKFAAGTYPLFSLLNHSCSPNAFYINHMTNGAMVVIANRRIKKGEQILITYVGGSFFSVPKVDRQSKLLPYNFNCNCIACRNNWVAEKDVALPPEPRFSCTSCTKLFSQEERDSAEFLKCELKKPLWKCRLCGAQYKLEELRKRYQVNVKLCVEAGELLQRGQPQEALRISRKLLDYFQTSLVPPEGLIDALLDCWYRSLSLILHLTQ